MGNDNKPNSNKDNHATTQILVFICMLICLVTLWFSVNTYFMLKNNIDIESGRVTRSEVTVLENK